MARRDPCSGCGTPTTNADRCRTCAPSVARRPASPCSGECGNRTTAKDGWCRLCRPTYMKQGPIQYDHAVWADKGPGAWQTIRGVRRWVPKTKEKAA